MKSFAFVFPGQGSQSVGMLDGWGDHPVVAQTLKEASDALGEDVGLLIKEGPKEICAVFGPTCDALDTISLAEELPDLQLGDLVYSENIGAYSHASSTYFNGFPPAKVLHINR